MSCRIYQSPGRTRVRLDVLEQGISDDLIAELCSLQGVKVVLPNQFTGSIVIYYDKDIRCSSSLLIAFRKFGLLENVLGFPVRGSLAITPKPTPVGFTFSELLNLFLRKALRI